MVDSPKVVLVEDNPDDELLIVRSLRRNNLANELVILRDGAEALDYFFARGDYTGRDVESHPNVVLLDIKLPKVDGLEVLRQLRQDRRTHYMPVVILTSSDEQTDLLRSYELKVNSYVRKPVEFAEFSEAIRELGLYWLILNAPPPQE